MIAILLIILIAAILFNKGVKNAISLIFAFVFLGILWHTTWWMKVIVSLCLSVIVIALIFQIIKAIKDKKQPTQSQPKNIGSGRISSSELPPELQKKWADFDKKKKAEMSEKST